MSISLFEISVGTYVQILAGAVGVLEKGATQLKDAEKILKVRLQDDMFNFRLQVIAVAHHSQGAIEGLQSGHFQPPDYSQKLDYPGLQRLVASALESLKAESAAAIDALADGKVLFKLGNSETPYTATNFILSFSLPNFYFHTTTMYDILRAQGVQIGKLDYLGPMRIGF